MEPFTAFDVRRLTYVKHLASLDCTPRWPLENTANKASSFLTNAYNSALYTSDKTSQYCRYLILHRVRWAVGRGTVYQQRSLLGLIHCTASVDAGLCNDQPQPSSHWREGPVTPPLSARGLQALAIELMHDRPNIHIRRLFRPAYRDLSWRKTSATELLS
jgi:hypothetical protein